MLLNEQQYKRLNRIYYHRQRFENRDKSLTDFQCYYLTTDPFYAYQYSGRDGYIKVLKFKQGLDICNFKSKQDCSKVEDFCRKNKVLKDPREFITILSEEDWLTFFKNFNNRSLFIEILQDLGYDGFFNIEVEDKLRGRLTRFSDNSLGFPAIGIFEESNMIELQTIHGFNNILKLPNMETIYEKEKSSFRKNLYEIYEEYGKLNQFEVDRLIYSFNVNNDERNRNCLSLITQDEISKILESFDPSVEEKIKKEARTLAKHRLYEWQGCKNIQQKDIERIAQSLYWRM